MFLDTLDEGCGKAGWRVHAYVLMGNHYHLLLETPEGNLVAGMKWLQGTYTQRFNSQHEVFGHVFQGRYKAVLVDGGSAEYFRVASTYIHLNPARARLIRVGEEPLWRYAWSSYPTYVGRGKGRPRWLDTARVLGSAGFGTEDRRAREGYEALVEGRVLELKVKKGREALDGEWARLRRGWYVGDEGFRGRLLAKVKSALKDKARGSFSGEVLRRHDEAAAEGRVGKGLEALGMTEERLRELPKGAPEKQVLAWWLRTRTTVSRAWIAGRLVMGDASRVTHATKAVREATRGELRRGREALLKRD